MAFAVALPSKTSFNTNPVASPDVDIAMFVGTKLILLSKNTQSAPEGYGCSGDGEADINRWKLDLMTYGQTLVNYAIHFRTDDGDAQFQAAQEFYDELQEIKDLETSYEKIVIPARGAMHWVAAYFADLWS